MKEVNIPKSELNIDELRAIIMLLDAFWGREKKNYHLATDKIVTDALLKLDAQLRGMESPE